MKKIFLLCIMLLIALVPLAQGDVITTGTEAVLQNALTIEDVDRAVRNGMGGVNSKIEEMDDRIGDVGASLTRDLSRNNTNILKGYLNTLEKMKESKKETDRIMTKQDNYYAATKSNFQFVVWIILAGITLLGVILLLVHLFVARPSNKEELKRLDAIKNELDIANKDGAFAKQSTEISKINDTVSGLANTLDVVAGQLDAVSKKIDEVPEKVNNDDRPIVINVRGHEIVYDFKGLGGYKTAHIEPDFPETSDILAIMEGTKEEPTRAALITSLRRTANQCFKGHYDGDEPNAKMHRMLLKHLKAIGRLKGLVD